MTRTRSLLRSSQPLGGHNQTTVRTQGRVPRGWAKMQREARSWQRTRKASWRRVWASLDWGERPPTEGQQRQRHRGDWRGVERMNPPVSGLGTRARDGSQQLRRKFVSGCRLYKEASSPSRHAAFDLWPEGQTQRTWEEARVLAEIV